MDRETSCFKEDLLDDIGRSSSKCFCETFSRKKMWEHEYLLKILIIKLLIDKNDATS